MAGIRIPAGEYARYSVFLWFCACGIRAVASSLLPVKAPFIALCGLIVSLLGHGGYLFSY